MFSDKEYITATKQLITTERSHVNFTLVRSLSSNVNADHLFDVAIRNKFMIRNCSSFPFLDNQYFRICFMSPDKNEELVRLILSQFSS